MVIRRVGPLSCAKIAGAVYAVIGLCFGLFFAAFGSLFSAAGMASDAPSGMPMIGALFGIGAIVILPILYGVMGFIATLISAAIYNLVAGVVGGIEIDVQTTPGA
jgi:hypothetical protein